MLFLWLAALGHAGPVAVVVDGEASPSIAEQLEAEFRLLDASLTVTADDVFGGASSDERLASDLARCIRDRRYDAVIALGPLVSAQAKDLRRPRIPVIAAVDLEEGAGPANVYSLPLRLDVTRGIEIAETLSGGEAVVVASPVLVESGLLPEGRLPAVAPIDVPDTVKSLVVLPLVAIPGAERKALFEGWAEQGLVTVSMQGSLDDGATAALSTSQGLRTVLRRVAVVLSDLDAGRRPVTATLNLRANDLKVAVPALTRLGLSVPFALLAEAEFVGIGESRQPIRLDEAVREAMANSPNLARLRAELAAEDTAVAQSIADWLPGVDVSLFASTTDPNAVSPLQAQSSVTGSLTAEQLLFSDGAVVNVNSQQDLRKARSSEWAAAEQDLAFDVSSAYVALIRAYELLEVRRADLDRVRESLQVARDRQLVGDVAATEVARWESEFASAEANLISAFADVQSVQISLNQLLGADPSRALEPAPLDEIVAGLPAALSSPSEATRLATALADFAEDTAPSLEQLDHIVQAQDRAARLQRRQYWMPTVAGSFTINGNFFLSNVDGNQGGGTTPTATATGVPGGFDTSTFIVDPPLFTWQAGASVSLPLFAGGGRRASQREAERSLQSLGMQRETLRQSVVARSRDAINQAVASALRAELGKVQVKAVQRTLYAAIDSYARGATTQTTVTEARTSALNAELGSTNATYDAVQAVFDVLYVAGALPTPSFPNGPEQLRNALTTAMEAP
ncbi:MAG: TolC family protein [Myxococcota bacterium]